MVATTGCRSTSDSTPSTCARDAVVATVDRRVTYLLQCSATTQVPAPLVALSVGQSLALSGPLAGPMRLSLVTGQAVVRLTDHLITALAPGDAVVDVTAGLYCAPVVGTPPTSCPLLVVHVA